MANIRTATASAKPPVTDPRQAPPLSQFQPATVEEITRLINTMPAKSCSLDPIPTWLLKRLTPHIAAVICKLCNLSLHNGVFPTPLKQALVLPILKKNNLDPDVASSYRPISNLPYISKVIKGVVARRFSSHLSHSSLLCQPDSLPTVPSTPRRRPCCPCITTWLAPSTTSSFTARVA